MAYDPNNPEGSSAGTQRASDANAQGIDANGNNTLISSPTYQSYSTGPGLQAGQAGPGVGYNQNAPGQGEQYASAALGYYGAGNIPGVSNNQQSNYQQFQQSTPADTSSYYANAQRLQDNDINKQMAARGQFGSSNAVGQISNADTNLAAQQANANAQYGLQRAQLGGSLAGGADAQSNAASQNQLGWTQGLGNLAFEGQQTGANRYQQGFQNDMSLANQLSGMEGANYGAATQNDQSLMNDAMNAQNGYLTENTTNDTNNANQTANDQNATVNFGMGLVKAAGGV